MSRSSNEQSYSLNGLLVARCSQTGVHSGKGIMDTSPLALAKSWLSLEFWCLPAVKFNVAIENGHRHSELSHSRWWFSIAMLVYQRVDPIQHFGWNKICIPKIQWIPRLKSAGWILLAEARSQSVGFVKFPLGKGARGCWMQIFLEWELRLL